MCCSASPRQPGSATWGRAQKRRRRNGLFASTVVCLQGRDEHRQHGNHTGSEGESQSSDAPNPALFEMIMHHGHLGDGEWSPLLVVHPAGCVVQQVVGQMPFRSKRRYGFFSSRGAVPLSEERMGSLLPVKGHPFLPRTVIIHPFTLLNRRHPVSSRKDKDRSLCLILCSSCLDQQHLFIGARSTKNYLSSRI